MDCFSSLMGIGKDNEVGFQRPSIPVGPVSTAGQAAVKQSDKRVFTSHNSVWNFVHLLQGDEDSFGRYSVCLVFPKTDQSVASITTAIVDAMRAGLAKYGDDFRPGKKVLQDGDTDRPGNPEFSGKYLLNACTSQPPQILDKSTRSLLTSKTDVHYGCMGPACVQFRPFSHSGHMGIKCVLLALMKVGEVNTTPNAASVFANYTRDR